MIPIDTIKPYKQEDPESGIVYLFRYLTEENYSDYDDAVLLGKKAKEETDELKTERITREYMRKLIDCFLIGWEKPLDFKNDLPDYKGKKPSGFFVGKDLTEMFRFVLSVAPKLMNISDDDIKN